MALYRNNDQMFEQILSRQSAERKIPVTFTLTPTSDGFSLTCGHQTVSVVCEHQLAEKSQHDNIVRQLSKLGGTPYECSGVELPDDFNYFIPSSLLTEMRRRLVDEMGKTSRVNTARPTGITRQAASSDPNISNRLACDFYGSRHLTAYELHPDERPLMQCRHCLRYALGYCVKHGGTKPTWHEPLSLRLADGRTFRLEFDCKNCQMNVYEK